MYLFCFDPHTKRDRTERKRKNKERERVGDKRDDENPYKTSSPATQRQKEKKR